jgi:predicted TIM-barrel fold metal-dependent hydrolase
MQNDGWSRRQFLAAAPLIVAGISSVAGGEAKDAKAVPWSTGTERPRMKAPRNATDCHHHIYDSRYPADAKAAVRPPDATIADYRLLQERLGTTRHVIVQPSTYGIDNSGLLDCLKQFGRKTTRGIAVVNSDVTDAELKQLDAAGVRGVRFNLNQAGGYNTWEMMAPLAKRIAAMNWHIQVFAPADHLVAHKDLFYRLPCPIVFDHLANAAAVKDPVFEMASELLQGSKAWVKLSGIYIASKAGPPAYADTSAVAQAFVKQAPERLVWGSDWPHPTAPGTQKPDDALLFDLFAEWVPTDVLRKRILVDNPARLYGF